MIRKEMRLAFAFFVIIPFAISACNEFAPSWCHVPFALVTGIYWFASLMKLIHGERK